jgi:UDP-4-amino-4,6-dideoxy-N-acetyl-beta-L-altrosamine transaminase
MIPYGRQDISSVDVEAVVEVLRSDFLTQGPMVPRFEETLARAVDAPEAVAFSSATAALHVACLALGLGPSDRLWTVPNTFVASANCGLYCGAIVDFVDINARTRNMDVEELATKLEAAERDGTLPKVVVPVDFAGTSADLASIRRLADRYGFRILEDASHAVGGYYQNRPVGSSELADVTVFSFHPVKIVTTGEGGAATTRSAEIAHRMRLLRNHGISRDPADMTAVPEGPWYYEQVMLGFNYRMSDIQAALGVRQFDRLAEFVARRHTIAARYHEGLAGLPVIRQFVPEGTLSALHLYVIELDETVRRTRAEVFAAMRSSGIGVNVHYIPVHLQPWYRALGFSRGDFPTAEKYYDFALTLPIHPNLSAEQQDYVMERLSHAIGT